MKVDNQADVVIAGGGPVGAALALGLRDSGLKTVLLEPRMDRVAASDDRTIALSHGSRLILDRLGVWPALESSLTPIRHISISQQRGFARVELEAEESGVPALGYVAGYAALQGTLSAALPAAGVRVIAGHALQHVESAGPCAVAITDAQLRLPARLVVIADGGSASMHTYDRTRDYHQAALVCDVASTEPHRNRAFERFTPAGPLALLPAAHGWSVIWTLRSEDAPQLAALGDAEFCHRLRIAFGTAAGEFSSPGLRRIFPLKLRVAAQTSLARTVLIGNAAQTLHPVAGQGLNLGLRDAHELARLIVTRNSNDPGDGAFVNLFFSQRRLDRTATILFTDSLIQLFCKDIPPLNCARNLALTAMSVTSPAKNFLTRRMMLGARG